MNAFYAQSGGVTAVINASACGVIEEARQQRRLGRMGRLYAGQDGILGALHENLIDTSKESAATIAKLRHTPGGAFGSCRVKLKSFAEDPAPYQRIVEVFRAHRITSFLYNGGNDSMDTANKVAQASALLGYPIICVGIPKTVDNDLVETDHCPGFGSVAKYVATSMQEAGLDIASMCKTSTKIFVLEVMGRHAGWITAAAGLAQNLAPSAAPSAHLAAPQILLFPEVRFDEDAFLARVSKVVARDGYCAIAVSEGLRNLAGEFLAESAVRDAFGHAQLGGVATLIAHLIEARLKLKHHWAVADYLQRSARHIASKTDVDNAYAVGQAAVRFAVAGQSGAMASLVRKTDALGRARFSVVAVPLAKVANREKMMPRRFIDKDGFHITPACRDYLLPLIAGEDFPPFKNGLPDIAQLRKVMLPKKLA